MTAHTVSTNNALAKVLPAKPIPAPPVVTPVIDYEPPAFGGPPVVPPAVALRSRSVISTEPAGPSTEEARALATAMLAAATFADRTLRRVLEVIDRRRPPAQIRPLLAAGLVDSLPAGTFGAGTARLRRVVAQISDVGGRVAEVAASYARGDRVGAIACRVELLETPTGPRWQLVALHIG